VVEYLITFIDRDHQWFKSQVGLPEEIAHAHNISRELSVCGIWSRTTNYSWSKSFHATEDLQITHSSRVPSARCKRASSSRRFSSLPGMAPGGHLIGKRHGKLRELYHRLDEGDHHLVRNRGSQPFSRARHVFGRAPNSDHDLRVWQCARSFALRERAWIRVEGGDNRDANRDLNALKNLGK
jgi:hypothetical protein